MKALIHNACIALVWFTVQVGVIGVGVVLDSDAMQWVGFVGVVVLVILAAVSVVVTAFAKSVDDARKHGVS